MTTRQFEKSLKSNSIRQITTQKPRKSPRQLSTAFLLRTSPCKFLFQFVTEIPIQILIIFTLRVWAACAAVTKSTWGNVGLGDVGTWGRGDWDVGTRGRGDVGTWGRGDSGRWGLGDVGTWGRGDVGTWGRGDSGTWRHIFEV